MKGTKSRNRRRDTSCAMQLNRRNGPFCTFWSRKVKSPVGGKCSGEVSDGSPDLPSTHTNYPEQLGAWLRLHIFQVGFDTSGSAHTHLSAPFTLLQVIAAQEVDSRLTPGQSLPPGDEKTVRKTDDRLSNGHGPENATERRTNNLR